MGGTAPGSDAEVPAFWAGLGLPGLIDIHVHFLPDRMLRKVWAYFDGARDRFGVAWPIRYRTGQGERLARLRALGVRYFTALSYPHKPGMARWLNAWALEFAAATPDCVPSATFFAEPAAATVVADALAAGARVFKAHLQVGRYDPTDPVLDAVWGQLAETGTPVVCHCGSGPELAGGAAPAALVHPGPAAGSAAGPRGGPAGHARRRREHGRRRAGHSGIMAGWRTRCWSGPGSRSRAVS